MPAAVVIPAFVVVFANLASLGLLIGNVGASRAYTVGLHTLFRDHLPAVVIAALVALVLTAAFSWRLVSLREGARFVLCVFVADVVAGFAPILVFNEITRHPDLPRVLITATVGGTQLLAIALGLLMGLGAGTTVRRRRGRAETSIG